ncbi:unnamed protein product [Chilo suppressalis]|uniref:UPAR/Ly6 domain-containing protein n=1 Tax=Chilo suppressalis TaxID=168631 RepID=A0ABN8EA51_CHISP|nr:unnamed protein product [Chilo suppressalis]
MHFQIQLALVVFCCIIYNTFGLRCYSCSYTSLESDRSCLMARANTSTVECSYRFCTIRRIEFLDPSGVVASFRRGCDQLPDYFNHEITDSTYRTFYRACTTDLCNIGNGIQSVGGMGLSPEQGVYGKNLLVPGTESSGTVIHLSVMLSLLLEIVFIHVVY